MLARVRATVLQWPQVAEKKKLGLPAFYVDKKVFLLWADEGPVFTCLSPQQRDDAARTYGGKVFEYKGKRYEDWCEVPCATDDELRAIEFLIRASYQAAHLPM